MSFGIAEAGKGLKSELIPFFASEKGVLRHFGSVKNMLKTICFFSFIHSLKSMQITL